jgi:hypothetical protein
MKMPKAWDPKTDFDVARDGVIWKVVHYIRALDCFLSHKDTSNTLLHWEGHSKYQGKCYSFYLKCLSKAYVLNKLALSESLRGGA